MFNRYKRRNVSTFSFFNFKNRLNFAIMKNYKNCIYTRIIYNKYLNQKLEIYNYN